MSEESRTARRLAAILAADGLLAAWRGCRHEFARLKPLCGSGRG